MIRGTRLLVGEEASLFFEVSDKLRASLKELGFQEVYLPSLWEQETFVKKAGEGILNQMYTFQDKGERNICLIPECTALFQQLWQEDWGKKFKQPYKVFYVQRCYRYEKPQAGRYREFTQIGIEILGNKDRATKEDAIGSLQYCLNKFDVPYKFNDTVKRGLSYYIEDGFEAEVEYLGAQKQIAGGGRYNEGIGWAVGLDRLVLAIQNKPK